jgi:hypothetical protein
VAVRLRHALAADDRRYERELGGLREREADPEEGGEDEDRRECVDERERGGDRRLPERDDDEQPRRLEAVDDHACVTG